MTYNASECASTSPRSSRVFRQYGTVCPGTWVPYWRYCAQVDGKPCEASQTARASRDARRAARTVGRENCLQRVCSAETRGETQTLLRDERERIRFTEHLVRRDCRHDQLVPSVYVGRSGEHYEAAGAGWKAHIFVSPRERNAGGRVAFSGRLTRRSCCSDMSASVVACRSG